MKLTDLNPSWVGTGGEGVFRTNEKGELEPAHERHGVAISFDCPCGRRDYDNGHTPKICVNISPPLDGGVAFEHAWERTGDTFETLTLRPSIQRVGGCAWHGFVTNGEVRVA